MGDKLFIPNVLEIKLRTLSGTYHKKNPVLTYHNKDINNQILHGFYISITLWLYRSFEFKGKITDKEILSSYNEKEGVISSLNKLTKTYTVDKHDYNISKKALENISNLLLSKKYILNGQVKDHIKEKEYLDKFYLRMSDKESNILKFIEDLKLCLGSLQKLVSFQWEGLSYGENEVLKLGSRIYSLIQTSEFIQSSPMLLTIDEGELGFHAEWQKKYLSLVLNLLSKLFPNLSLQIITTSHSPFLVSDLPKENIIFLDKDKNTGNCIVSKPEDMTHTFGANIHSLYRNSFFLENGLMGEFAKGKIDQVIRNLNNHLKHNEIKMSPKDMQFVIQQIGEPIIKNKLQEMYDNFEFGLDDEIIKLETKLAELKKRNQ